MARKMTRTSNLLQEHPTSSFALSSHYLDPRQVPWRRRLIHRLRTPLENKTKVPPVQIFGSANICPCSSSQPVLRDRLFTTVLVGAFAHGFYLVTDLYDSESK